MLIDFTVSVGFHVTPSLKSGAKLLSFFLIGVILLRNYHFNGKKMDLPLPKPSKQWQKNRESAFLIDKMPIHEAKMWQFSQITIYHPIGDYSNT